MKGKIILTIFIAIFLLALLPCETVIAGSIVYPISFEGYASGLPYSDSFMTSKRHSGQFNVSTINPHSGTRSFRASGYGGWFNFTYSNSSYLTNIKFNIYRANNNAGYYSYIGFYNNSFSHTYTTSGIPIDRLKYIILLRWFTSSGAFEYIDDSGNWNLIGTTSGSGRYWINLSVIDNIGDINYWLNSTHVHGVCSNSSMIVNNYRIDRMLTWNSGNDINYYDDMNFTISDSYTVGGGGGSSLYCGNDVSNYYQIGDIFGTDDSDQVNSPELFEYHNVKRATQIKGVALKVSVDQYNDDSNTANYSLSINGLSLGNPDCFSQASNGYDWLLYWSCNVNIQNETTAFVFKHTKANSFGRYWQVCVGNFGQDLDGDADAEYYYSDEFQDCGWQWFGGIIPWWVCSGYTANQIVGKDLAMSFFITNLGTSQIFDYPSSLGLHGWDYKNATGYIYSLGKSITCSYTLGDNAYDYQISLYKNTTQILTSGFPTSVNYPSGSVGYTPFTIGKYKFQLNSTHAIDNVTAYVIGTLPNFYIFTNPVITNQYSYYSVYYKYYHPQGFDGYATMFDILGNFPNYYLNSYSRNIFNNVSSNFTYFSTSSSAEYWTLFANKTNAFNNVGNLHKHFIRLQGISTNTINVVPTSILLSHEQLKNYNFTIYGQHTFVGTDISVFVNNNFIAIIGDSQNYILTYNPPDFGSYIVSLRILQDGLWVILCNASFIVISSDTPTSEAEKPLLEPPYTYIFGALITVVFIILPVIGIGKLNIQSDIIKYVPIFTGVVGFILSCLIGLFPWYSIFALLFILIMIITVLYLAKNKSG